jgi:hypothetical protein
MGVMMSPEMISNQMLDDIIHYSGGDIEEIKQEELFDSAFEDSADVLESGAGRMLAEDVREDQSVVYVGVVPNIEGSQVESAQVIYSKGDRISRDLNQPDRQIHVVVNPRPLDEAVMGRRPTGFPKKSDQH